MTIIVDIENVSEDDDRPPPANADIEHWVKQTINHRRGHAEISIRIVDEAEISALNSKFRNQQGPTNVLSFPADLPEQLELPLLGDVVICAPVVAREAQEQQKTDTAHWAHMVVHGTLHLLGYDHIKESDAAMMEQLEIDILAQLNFPNPYLNPADAVAQRQV